MPRLYLDTPLTAGPLVLPPGPARHAQVLRLQPGEALVLFDGRGGEWSAEVATMGRREVAVNVLAHDAVERELPFAVTLAVGVPANERFDALIEKATELGAAAVQPLQCERSVVRLSGERAERRAGHWQAVAVAAAEQSGRTRVPVVAPMRRLDDWLAQVPPPGPPGDGARLWLLDPSGGVTVAAAVASMTRSRVALTFLSGPEGGFSDAETALARRCGAAALHLGPRVLRADTAPLAALAAWSACTDTAPPTRP